MKKVAIVGSRDFSLHGREQDFMGAIITNLMEFDEVTVFSGGAAGVDTLARNVAVEHGFHICNANIHDEPIDGNHFVEYLAMWRDRDGKLDRGAGFKRNRRIVAEADFVIALFADGPRSPGTSNTVELAVEKGVPVHIWHEGAWTRG